MQGGGKEGNVFLCVFHIDFYAVFKTHYLEVYLSFFFF